MTGGTGVSHSEFSVDSSAGEAPLRGLQLWIALPHDALGAAAAFEQLSDLPVVQTAAMDATVFVGEFGGKQSPATVHTPLVGVDIVVGSGQQERFALNPSFEHAVLLIDGDVTIDDRPVPSGPLLYLGPGRDSTRVKTAAGTRVVLIGGAPFEHDLVMWWNFVGRSHEDIVSAREDWDGPVRADSSERRNSEVEWRLRWSKRWSLDDVGGGGVRAVARRTSRNGSSA